MNVSGISSVGGAQQGQAVPAGIAPSQAGSSSFADLLHELVKDTNNSQSEVQISVEDLVSGKSESLHEVVMTASQAELSFRLMMEIRNRLISSYQEIIRMQV